MIADYVRSYRSATLGGTAIGIGNQLKNKLGIPVNTDGTWAIEVTRIPDGYRRLDPDKCNGPKPDGTQYYHQTYKRWRLSGPADKWYHYYMYAVPDVPDITVTVKVNGVPVDPSTLSAETWSNLRTR
jgi:hypothetical protein